jgi:indole-3-glycerol phosphate synthase
MQMDDVLNRIYASKAAYLESEMEREPYESLRERALAGVTSRRPFVGALRAADGHAIVAEIKRASPSAGLIARDFDPVAIGRTYDAAGADAISILTEQDHFLGDIAFLRAVRDVTSRPILRKDFLWAPYHVAQSAAHGADAVLLIVAGLTDEQIEAYLCEAREYALDVLVEVHDVEELQRALRFDVSLIGVNNRNLRTMVTDLAVSEHVLPKVPTEIFAIAESGMREPDDLERLRAAGARGFLIGEALMRSGDPGATIASLRRVRVGASGRLS